MMMQENFPRGLNLNSITWATDLGPNSSGILKINIVRYYSVTIHIALKLSSENLEDLIGINENEFETKVFYAMRGNAV